MTARKLVILAAITGGSAADRDGAKVPTQPEEIAEEALRCYNAGASVVHIHARAKDKVATGDPSVFEDIIGRMREKCDALVQITNGIGWIKDAATGQIRRPTDDERLALLHLKNAPELYSLAGSSWDFYHPGHPRNNEFSFMNSTDLLRKWVPQCLATGGALEIEIAQTSAFPRLRRLADEGVFDGDTKRLWFDYCLGFGGMGTSFKELMFTRDEQLRFFPNARWQVVGTHFDQFKIATVGMLMDCDIVRVGFEDNMQLPDGKVARTNAELVEAIARIAKIFGREPATVEEARAVLGLN